MTTTKRTLIVGVDPGVTTGVATWDVETKTFHSFQADEHEFYEFVNGNADRVRHMQIEFFTINQATVRKTVVYDSLYLIGYLRFMSYSAGFPIGFTKPADVMSSFDDAALKRVEWFQKGQGHANDAARHLSHYCTRNRLVEAKHYLPKG